MFTGPLFEIKLHLQSTALLSGFQISPGAMKSNVLPRSFEIQWVMQYLVNLMGLVGIVNATVYETELIFRGLGHGKFSYFLTVLCH